MVCCDIIFNNFWHNLQLVEGGQYVVEVEKEVEVK